MTLQLVLPHDDGSDKNLSNDYELFQHFLFVIFRWFWRSLSTKIETRFKNGQRHWVKISRFHQHEIGELQSWRFVSTINAFSNTIAISFRARTHSTANITARKDKNDKKIFCDNHCDYLCNFSSNFWRDCVRWNCGRRSNRLHILSLGWGKFGIEFVGI